jgi:hypothetical protein
MPDVWRDLQIGAKVDIPFSGIANVVDKGTLTLSGLFVDLHQMPLGVSLMVNGVSVTQPAKLACFKRSILSPGKRYGGSAADLHHILEPHGPDQGNQRSGEHRNYVRYV